MAATFSLVRSCVVVSADMTDKMSHIRSDYKGGNLRGDVISALKNS
jgi:hypothetical protein